jgi:hypothetical protein
MTSKLYLAVPTTPNLGDDVQLAALPELLKDYTPVDREVGLPGLPPEARLLLSGWVLHSHYWPPAKVDSALVIGIHIPRFQQKLFATKESVAWLKQHEPIGCRDYETQELLDELHVQNYFSGCLSLLNEHHRGQKRIITIEFDDMPARFLPGDMGTMIQPLTIGTPIGVHGPDHQYRLVKVQARLRYFATLRGVVTRRLHTALAAITQNTPVVFVPYKIDEPRRIEPYEAFFNVVQPEDYEKRNYTIPPAPAQMPGQLQNIAARLKMRINHWLQRNQK